MVKSSPSDMRTSIRAKRRNIPLHLQQDLSVTACERMLSQKPLLKAKHVALYLSQDGELDTQPLIQALWERGVKTYLPRLHPFCAGHLLFLHYHSDTPLVANRFGILEPILDVTNVMPIKDMDVIVTPLVAFDVAGQRLGMGGGYYDRTLAHRRNVDRPIPMGYAHDCQQVAHIEAQAWDIPLPYIVTPTRAIISHLSK
ncbi:5-formyltetrahydrofolate cyclo-ligase [uncultured Shewanella sp.]|uniref:5-formyltetrahydrofolate cyclo-ligase n=1 Tax=uncultured Shewanella sp. TaxID=173975 RepID=UPI00260C7425|nr:5-formyltetrahydrofolate cyclo-ligase [uncultured Shewanella sp.]